MRTWLMAGLFTTASVACISAAPMNNYSVVNTDELKRWYDSSKPMTVIDARTEENYDKTTLPDAIWLPANSPSATIQSTLPVKNRLIVVYCWSLACPASANLANRLSAAGYTNVYEYPDGLEDWMQNGYPTTNQ